MKVLAKLDRFFAAFLRAFVIAALTITLVLITLGVIARVMPVFSMSGYDEVIEWLIAWMTFAGTIALWRQGLLFRIDLISMLPSRLAVRSINILTQILMLAFAVVFTWKGWEFAVDSTETMPFLFVSKMPWYASMPVCGAFMIVYAITNLVRTVLGIPTPSAASLSEAL
jgi:TRAP-type C4-dicarboxylate transport system permease small subunit